MCMYLEVQQGSMTMGVLCDGNDLMITVSGKRLLMPLFGDGLQHTLSVDLFGCIGHLCAHLDTHSAYGIFLVLLIS